MVTRPNVAMRSLEENRQAVLDLVLEHKGRSVAVFGSAARGDATEDSDIDLLVEFEPTSSLLDLIDLEDDLRDLLGIHVDVISAGALLERDTEIRRDAVPL